MLFLKAHKSSACKPPSQGLFPREPDGHRATTSSAPALPSSNPELREISYHSIIPSFEHKLFYLFLDIHQDRDHPHPPLTHPQGTCLRALFIDFPSHSCILNIFLVGHSQKHINVFKSLTLKRKKKRPQSSLYHLYLVSVFIPFTVWLLKEQSSSSPLSLLNSLQLPIPLQNIPKNVLKRSSIAS